MERYERILLILRRRAPHLPRSAGMSLTVASSGMATERGFYVDIDTENTSEKYKLKDN